MSNWLDVSNIDELTLSTRRVVDVEGINVAVFNLGGEYFAIKDECPHDGGVLSNGELDGEVIICPRHGARFSIRTGTVLGPPAYEDLITFPVRISQGKVQVEIDRT
ncbi:non-heme iron oxygenase ferredoxin subunit [Sideroxydans sp. CL21]|uniref:Rieske (2Fe-2S) protein n=1 Tax=Sideroxydans sp. CL21 TaxID=2600596 RepID=UPI0024BD3390|nr:non-heme iron oxygenase ferredoxin subunit [Sideroxydans sp. CL21]